MLGVPSESIHLCQCARVRSSAIVQVLSRPARSRWRADLCPFYSYCSAVPRATTIGARLQITRVLLRRNGYHVSWPAGPPDRVSNSQPFEQLGAQFEAGPHSCGVHSQGQAAPPRVSCSCTLHFAIWCRSHRLTADGTSVTFKLPGSSFRESSGG